MKKILVANRGEIALRIMKSAKKMGIKTVAVYSEIDRHTPHVLFADEAIEIGPAPSAQSYLVIDKIIDAAKKTGAEGIHPGYGFLSENSEFAKAVTDAGIIFIGPNVHAIEVMGSKLAAKEAVKAYDIPMVPGIDEAIEDVEEAKKIAIEIGFPILIKASAGGGGKGMRIVEHIDELSEQMERAISEAESAFGDGSVFIEKYVTSPRHIELQVLADAHGNVVHLFERECSIQRRHQKVVEEAPSSVLTPQLREEMGAAAVRVAQACNYEGAGTVEFLLDDQLNFYFLEMNTRLQVEHPVTELISGVDLVEQQIRIARGEKLSFTQSDLNIEGHAMELRVYAEDPMNNFLPSIGTLHTYRRPEGDNIRVDDGYEEGMTIPIYYDPMIAKLITYGSTREESIDIMKRAIAEYKIEGIETTLDFGAFVFRHEDFISGKFDTHFVKKNFSAESVEESQHSQRKVAAIFAVKQYIKSKSKLKSIEHNSSIWTKSRNQ
ncbi:MAG: acetyl-CoA carboxylase biotin carboxylase subunit [Saprospiraceae bacterium]|nr:acetyl-CoA carboxylase biotin carboxylase subunit [Saprospiraceae bacterium]